MTILIIVIWCVYACVHNFRDIRGEATLIQVSWLDVSGMVSVERGGVYRVSFEVEMKPDAFGWNGSPVLVMAKLGKKGAYDYREVTLTSNSKIIPDPNPQQKQLDVTVPSNLSEKDIYFGLYEVWSGKWKGGLVIKKAKLEFLPSN